MCRFDGVTAHAIDAFKDSASDSHMRIMMAAW